MTRIKEVIKYLEDLAPASYQESYDNSGLLTGNKDAEVTGVLITLDTVEAVVDEAIQHGCNLIISHHPIIFKGLTSLTGRSYIERTIIKAIRHNIAIYAIHTNLDNVEAGVNNKICEKIGLVNTRILKPKTGLLSKLVVFCPTAQAQRVKEALFAAGAGNIGNYAACSFTTEGEGQFRPNEQANPTIGTTGQVEKVTEARIEVLIPAHQAQAVLTAMQEAHPYEEVAYYLTPLENRHQQVGSGMVGSLPHAIPSRDFLTMLKKNMHLSVIRHTALHRDEVRKIAVCGGSGSFLLRDAIAAGADVFVTADFKYHEFFDAENKIIIADVGHYESEVFTKELIHELLSEKFSSFALNLSNTVTNPISYL